MSQTPNLEEIWQVEVAGQIYEAPLRELPDWIEEGSLQPEDMVRKGSRRWAKARNVPTLIPFFNAREKGERLPIFLTSSDASVNRPTEIPEQPAEIPIESRSMIVEARPPSADPRPIVSDAVRKVMARPGHCSRHPHSISQYSCSGCFDEFCRLCPNSYGGNVKICPSCGSLCRSLAEPSTTSRSEPDATLISDQPFGLNDLVRAIAFPWKFRSSLILGGAMFAGFTLGQSASAMGGFLFVGASLMCAMLANMLTFGTLINTISNFTQGRLKNDFLPAFDDFSYWDDVVHPFILSIGAYLSAFGPFIITAAAGIYLIAGAITEQQKKFEEELVRVPGTPHYAPDRTMEQSKDVQDLLWKVREHNERQMKAARERALNETEGAEYGSAAPSAGDEVTGTQDTQIPNTDRQLAGQRYSYDNPAETIGDPKGVSDPASILMNIIRLAAPLVVIAGLALIWGLIYFPAACAVAGYSRSFLSTINPLVGLDTIRRMGMVYVKLIAMCALLAIAGAIAGLILQLVFLPFNLPWIGNVPAIVVGGFISFYIWAIFCCILGYALVKSSARLGLTS
ncbi:MAG TPA: hypothetical protein PKD26_11540 [Pyrinomonadaceae bacterium]|nr:hypothetical protein [Pyrinomonadaceae bacterium]